MFTPAPTVSAKVDQSEVVRGASTVPYRPVFRINLLMAPSQHSLLSSVIAATTTSSTGCIAEAASGCRSVAGFGAVFGRISHDGAAFSSHSTYAARPFSVDRAMFRTRWRRGSPRARSDEAMNVAFSSALMSFSIFAWLRCTMICSSTLSSHASSRIAGRNSCGSGSPIMI